MPTTLPPGELPNTPPPAPKLPAGPGVVVIGKPCWSNVFDAVSQPEARVRVVGKPRSSQPVTVSRPEAGASGEDGEGDGAAEEIGVDAANVW